MKKMLKIAIKILLVLTIAVTTFSPMAISAQEKTWPANETLLSENAVIVAVQLQEGIWQDTTLALAANNVIDAVGSTDDSLASYYPLHVGNSWTYGSHTETIVDTQRIEGNLYFLFNDGTLKRMTEDNKIFVKHKETEYVWCDFGANVGDSWLTFDGCFEVTLDDKESTIEVPAGIFTNCYEFFYECCAIDCNQRQWYAPNVGCVATACFCPDIHLLIHAVIDGVEIGVLKGDVDGNDELDVSDVLLIVSIIIGQVDPAPDQFWAADMNGDSTVDILDVVMIVNQILEGL